MIAAGKVSATTIERIRARRTDAGRADGFRITGADPGLPERVQISTRRQRGGLAGAGRVRRPTDGSNWPRTPTTGAVGRAGGRDDRRGLAGRQKPFAPVLEAHPARRARRRSRSATPLRSKKSTSRAPPDPVFLVSGARPGQSGRPGLAAAGAEARADSRTGARPGGRGAGCGRLRQ